MAEGAWIFLSHSNYDFDKVREVRNFLELKGHHPLMFFLKCLNDDDEVDDLIRREIESRSWFILCDSANARKSRWVQAEILVIKGLPTKTYKQINLDDSSLDLEAELFSLTRKASVFLSYAKRDSTIAENIRNELRKHDFGVFSDLALRSEEDWQVRPQAELHNAARRGAVLILLSRESVRSEWQQREVALAAEISKMGWGRSNIIPVYIDGGFEALEYAPSSMRQHLSTIKGLELSTRRFEENMVVLMTRLRDFEWIR